MLAAAGDVAGTGRIVDGYPQAAREFAENELLPAWAEAYSRQDLPAADRRLRILATLGEALVRRIGDAMVHDSVVAIESATNAPSAQARLGRLARGHLSYRTGKRLYEGMALWKASRYLTTAAAELRSGGSPFWLWADFFQAFCTFRRDDSAGSVEIEQLQRRTGRAYPVLLGHLEWTRGLIHNQHGRFTEALAHYTSALARFEQAHQPASAASVHFLLAESLLLLGEPHQAGDHLQAALSHGDQIFKPRWMTTVLNKAAENVRLSGQLRVALLFQNEALHHASLDGGPVPICETLIARGRTLDQLGALEAATRDLAAARSRTEMIADPSMRRLVEGQLSTAEGELFRERDPSRAIAALTTALARRLESGAEVTTTALYVARGRALLAMGDKQRAEHDFRAGIRAFEQRRPGIPSDELRISFFAQARSAFDELIRLQVDVHRDPWAALQLSERARARELLTALLATDPRPPPVVFSASAIQRRLPPRLVVLEYAVLEERTLAWVLSAQTAGFFELAVSSRDLQRLAHELLAALEQGRPEAVVRSAAGRLYDLLIRPLAMALPDGATVVLALDKELHELPFAVLFDTVTGRYLLATHPLIVVPSGTLFLRSLSLGQAGQPLSGQVLVVGNPAFDHRSTQTLSALPGSELEARKIAALYPEATVLVGKAATRERFIEAARGAVLVHFAGHAIINDDFPLLSRLLLAPERDSGAEGALFAQDLYRLRFPHTRLVVLAACRSARAGISPGEGALSLARPFLAAGVSSVVASLWSIDDATGTEFFTEFHRRLLAGSAPVDALRQAQLAMLGSTAPALRHPSVWGAFEVVQGS
jgi:CHAT domain-containing protein